MGEVPVPEVTGPFDVVVRIGGAGVCRTDLHILEGQWADKSQVALPYTIGHENAGWVHAVGDAVTNVAEGDKVIRRALDAGYAMRSMLLEEKWLPSMADVVARVEAPVYLADLAVNSCGRIAAWSEAMRVRGVVNQLAVRMGADLSAGVPYYGGTPTPADAPSCASSPAARWRR